MATQTGIKVVFGYTGTDGIAATGLTAKGLFQSHEYAITSPDEVKLKSAIGKVATRIFPEEVETATIEWIPGSATDVAGARTSKADLLALRHTVINITACADAPELVNDNWFVDDVKITGSNVGEHKVTLMLIDNDGITSAPA